MITGLTGVFPEAQLRTVRGRTILRLMHKCLPLGRHYHPVFSLLNSSRGFVTAPFDRFQLVHPAAYRKEVTKILLLGTDVIPEFSLLAPVVRQLNCGCLVDIGANIGLYTLSLRSVSALPIIAYEPQPFLSKLLRWTVSLNGLTNIEVRPVACGATKGEVPFHVGINGAIAVEAEVTPVNDSPTGLGTDGNWEHEARITQKDRPVVKVLLTTLDNDLAEGPELALLKIDCEGFEADILAGAERLLERKRPYLFVEIHPDQLERTARRSSRCSTGWGQTTHLSFGCLNTVDPGRNCSGALQSVENPRAIGTKPQPKCWLPPTVTGDHPRFIVWHGQSQHGPQVLHNELFPRHY